MENNTTNVNDATSIEKRRAFTEHILKECTKQGFTLQELQFLAIDFKFVVQNYVDNFIAKTKAESME